jgi:hypothetical protein
LIGRLLFILRSSGGFNLRDESDLIVTDLPVQLEKSVIFGKFPPCFLEVAFIFLEIDQFVLFSLDLILNGLPKAGSGVAGLGGTSEVVLRCGGQSGGKTESQCSGEASSYDSGDHLN